MKKWIVGASMLGVLAAVFVLCQPSPAIPAPREVQQPSPDAPRILGEIKYKPHQLVKLQAVNVPNGAGLIWRVSPRSNVQRATTIGTLCEFAAPPGQYEVELLIMTQSPTGLSLQEVFTTVVIESCHPPDPPKPDPKPDPKPEPPKPDPKGGTLDASNAIGRIQFGNSGCSATVIYPRRADGRWNVVTAAHCNGGVGQRGTITMPKDNKKYGIRVVAHDRTSDLCWMVTEESIDDICYAKLAPSNPEVGVAVWHQGYGFHLPRNREDGVVRAAANSQGQIQFFLNVSSGDSGGGIFRADTNEWIAATCCTQGIAQKTNMWGGGVDRAKQMLAALPTHYEPFSEPPPEAGEWVPLQLPVIR